MKIMTKESVEQERLMQRLKDSITPISDDRSRFEAACENFRNVCGQIGTLIGQDFKGGYDDMEVVANFIYSLDLTTEQGKETAIRANSLVSAWSGANDFCIYEAKRIGLGQPDWWKDCWGITDSSSVETVES